MRTKRTIPSPASETSSTTSRARSSAAQAPRTGHHQFERNCYWNAAGKTPIFPGGLSLKQWQAKGQDVQSTVADPKFVIYKRYDFHLQERLAGAQAGFSAHRHEQNRFDGAGGMGGPPKARQAAGHEIAGRPVRRHPVLPRRCRHTIFCGETNHATILGFANGLAKPPFGGHRHAGRRRAGGPLFRGDRRQRHLVGPIGRGKVNADGSDGPLGSLTGRRDAVRRLKAKGPLSQPIIVLLRGGKYTVSEPVQFRARLGTKDAPITYAAYPGEKPVLSGGVAITDWRKAEGPLWTTVVPGVKEGSWYFRSLFVDGRRCHPARTPNEGPKFPRNPSNRSIAKPAPKPQRTRCRGWACAIRMMTSSRGRTWTTPLWWSITPGPPRGITLPSVDFAHKIVHFTNPSDLAGGLVG